MSTGMCVRSSLVLSPGVPPADAENVVDGVLADGEGSDGPADGLADVDGFSLAVPMPSEKTMASSGSSVRLTWW